MDGTGKSLRSEAESHLQQAMRNVQNVMNDLRKCKGIGTEFSMEEFEDLYDDINNIKKKMAGF